MVDRPLIAVLTCPRGKSYLDDTLASLERGGVGAVDAKRLIVFDGPARVIDRDWPPGVGWGVHSLGPSPQGNLRAFLGVLQEAQDRDADRLLFFEDDVVVCKNAVVKMLQTQVPADCALVSFFDMKEIPWGSEPGIYKVSAMGCDGRGYWGSQSLLWPRRTIDYLLARKHEILDGQSRHSSDCLFGSQLLHSPWPRYAVHVPNLVEHIGDLSAIWTWTPKVNRKALNFLGEDHDALGV